MGLANLKVPSQIWVKFMVEKQSNLTRRDIVKKGAAVTGALVIGSSAASGAVAAKGNGAGGKAYLTNYGVERFGIGTEFIIQYREEDPDIWLRGVQAACDAGAKSDYIAYRIQQFDGSENAGLFVNPKRNVNTSAHCVVTEVSKSCGTGDLEHHSSTDGERDISRIKFESVE